ncbi:24218_t:CDS:2, partial [Dentiscutata erythropus]
SILKMVSMQTPLCIAKIDYTLQNIGFPPYILKTSGLIKNTEFDIKTFQYEVTISIDGGTITELRTSKKMYPNGFDISVQPENVKVESLLNSNENVRIIVPNGTKTLYIKITKNTEGVQSTLKREKLALSKEIVSKEIVPILVEKSSSHEKENINHSKAAQMSHRSFVLNNGLKNQLNDQSKLRHKSHQIFLNQSKHEEVFLDQNKSQQNEHEEVFLDQNKSQQNEHEEVFLDEEIFLDQNKSQNNEEVTIPHGLYIPPPPKYPPVTSKYIPPPPENPLATSKYIPPPPENPPATSKYIPPPPENPPATSKYIPPPPENPPATSKYIPPPPEYPSTSKYIPPLPNHSPATSKRISPPPKSPPATSKRISPPPKSPPAIPKYIPPPPEYIPAKNSIKSSNTSIEFNTREVLVVASLISIIIEDFVF